MNANIQDISEGSVMWKLVTGINQRLGAVGLQSLRVDETGVSRASPGGIFPGANIQSVELWSSLQSAVSIMRRLWFKPPENGVSYTGQSIIDPPGFVPIAEEEINPAYRAYNGDLDLRSSNDTTMAGDIIGQWLIDDLMAAISKMIYFRVSTPLIGGTRSLPGSRSSTLCQTAYQLGLQSWQSSTNGIGSTPSVWVEGSLRTSAFGFSVGSTSLSCRGQVTYSSPVAADVIVLLFFRPSESDLAFYPPISGAVPNTLWEVGRYANSHTLSINDAGITYQDQYPLQYLGINCGNLGQSGFRADMTAVAKGDFVDLN
jgi:hypothetical protein